jgi:hypothetical protein
MISCHVARLSGLASFFLVLGLLLGGCSSSPATTHSGFLSDYSKLRAVNDRKMNFISPELKTYRSFMVDPVQFRAQRSSLKAADRAEIAAYMKDAIERVLQGAGYTLVAKPSADTARFRLAITNVHESTWWMKVHPGSNLAGAGRGGAAMEGEIVDANTGDQLAAVVQAGTGSQFTAFNYSTVSDIKSTIDEWAKVAAERFDELHKTGR